MDANVDDTTLIAFDAERASSRMVEDDVPMNVMAATAKSEKEQKEICTLKFNY